MKKINILYVTLLLAMLIISSGCETIASIFIDYKLYEGDYPELFTVAIDSLLGADGDYQYVYDRDMIKVIDTDDYGRVLFTYSEDDALPVGNYMNFQVFLICQHYDDKTVYYYPDNNYGYYHGDAIEELTEFKELNDWGKELNLDKCTKKEIVEKKVDFHLPEARQWLVKIYNDEFGEMLKTDKQITANCVYLTSDEYGRSIYCLKWHFGRESGIFHGYEYGLDEDEHVLYCAIALNPDGSYNQEKYLLLITPDVFTNIQTELVDFKNRNSWNQPFDN